MRRIKSIVSRFAFLTLVSAPPLGNIQVEWGKDSLLALSLRATASRVPRIHFVCLCS